MKENNFSKVGSERRYGLELESKACDNYMQLNRTGWGAKPDGSVAAKEFFSAIFRGNRGLRSIRRLCEYANENNWVACHKCGFHVHFNMRHESVDSMKAIAYAYYATRMFWRGRAREDRVGCDYCRAMVSENGNLDRIENQDDWDEFCSHRCRDIWANWQAYRWHKSLEIRLHEGTFDADKIVNWIRAHINFIDWASATGYDDTVSIVHREDHTELITSIWDRAGCNDLAEFYRLGTLVGV